MTNLNPIRVKDSYYCDTWSGKVGDSSKIRIYTRIAKVLVKQFPSKMFLKLQFCALTVQTSFHVRFGEN